MHSIATGASDTGLKRARNEDRLLIDATLDLYAVADGMGGHAAGDVAATVAVRTATLELRRRWSTIDAVRRGWAGPEALARLCREAVEAANSEVFRIASENPSLTGMGSTLTLLVLAGDVGALAHVGDSRLYRLRDGELEQLSSDHTVAAELARHSDVSPERLAHHPLAHVLLRSVGECDTVQVETRTFELEDGDRFLLCSDGLTGHANADVLARELDHTAIAEIPRRLVDLANAAGGSDNITAIAIEVVDADLPVPVRAASPLRHTALLGARDADGFFPGESPAPLDM